MRETASNCAVVEGEVGRLAERLGMTWRDVVSGWVGSYQCCGPATMPE